MRAQERDTDIHGYLKGFQWFTTTDICSANTYILRFSTNDISVVFHDYRPYYFCSEMFASLLLWHLVALFLFCPHTNFVVKGRVGYREESGTGSLFVGVKRCRKYARGLAMHQYN
jgi:hypothetical protein